MWQLWLLPVAGLLLCAGLLFPDYRRIMALVAAALFIVALAVAV